MVQSLRSPRIVGFVGLRPWDDNQKTWRGDELRRTQIQRVVGEVSRFIDSWIIILVAKFSWVFAVQTLLLVNSAVELFNLSWVDSKKTYIIYIYMAQNPSAQPPHQPGQLLHVLLELRHGLILCGPPSSHSAIRGKSNPERSVANHITGWWYTYPSEKWWSSSVGMIIPFPIWWESHFNQPCSSHHQAVFCGSTLGATIGAKKHIRQQGQEGVFIQTSGGITVGTSGAVTSAANFGRPKTGDFWWRKVGSLRRKVASGKLT